MDSEELQGAYDQLKKEHEQLKEEHDRLKESVDSLTEERDTLKTEQEEAKKRLDKIDQAVKDAKVKEILEGCEGVWTEEDLSKMEMDQLELILKSFEGVKATRKGIRPSQAGADTNPENITVGDLFHKPLGEVED